MTLVFPDTNILLWPFAGGPDFREAINEAMPGCDIRIASCVLEELEMLGTHDAKSAAEFCQTMMVINLGIGGVDNVLLEAARRGAVVATNDRELINRILDNRGRVLRPRGGYKLELLPAE
ncbi:MAG: hypothetical protein BEU05_01645 [Marine Group III euryarchaeote CG-Bathy2]|uniref:VapC9 PIN-like domain-containing protein n=3 Tax=Methanobacteriati TaxID=3366610 RepID=A0A075GHH6_9EURY|nr:hypothetical protein [uncultured marine group II/III euryarchaeote KM3_141_A08]AIF20385.1 hypothetical protein [uncultured marine group II/III euryarchaeote KM3_89_F04]OIR10236.1 MAG: hypothetical protein BEU05_01645 [Marine Group III euryarchaeote CG-Bathy2]